MFCQSVLRKTRRRVQPDRGGSFSLSKTSEQWQESDQGNVNLGKMETALFTGLRILEAKITSGTIVDLPRSFVVRGTEDGSMITGGNRRVSRVGFVLHILTIVSFLSLITKNTTQLPVLTILDARALPKHSSNALWVRFKAMWWFSKYVR